MFDASTRRVVIDAVVIDAVVIDNGGRCTGTARSA
jgi:hypothetical protein